MRIFAIVHDQIQVYSNSLDVNSELVAYILKSGSKSCACIANKIMKHSNPCQRHLEEWKILLDSMILNEKNFSMSDLDKKSVETGLRNIEVASCALTWLSFSSKYVREHCCYSFYIEELEMKEDHQESLTYPAHWLLPLYKHSKTLHSLSDKVEMHRLPVVSQCILELIRKLSYQRTTLPIEDSSK